MQISRIHSFHSGSGLVHQRQKTLQHQDLFGLAPADSTETNAAALGTAMRFEAQRRSGGSFYGACRTVFGQWWCGMAARLLVGVCFAYVNPALIRVIVEHVEGVDELPAPVAFGAAGGMFLMATGNSISNAMFFWRGDRLSVRINEAVRQCVFEKALALTPAAKQRFGAGAITSFMQIDANKIAQEPPPRRSGLAGGTPTDPPPVSALGCTQPGRGQRSRWPCRCCAAAP